MRPGEEAGEVALIAVVGGANVDVEGFPAAGLRLGDSNPGSVRIEAGGVGRNVAENLARLGHSVRFISVFGDDEASRNLLAGLNAVGVDTSHSIVQPGRSASYYLCVLEREGTLHAAVSDMELMEALGPDRLRERAEALRSADLCVFDANLGREALEAGIALCTPVPCLLDTVSAAKAARARGCIGSFFAVKPNETELEVLSGIALGSDRALEQAAGLLHRRGVRRLFVSLGRRGLYFSDGALSGVAKGPPVEPVNVSGAGDALTAAIADGLAARRPIEETAAFAAAAAALTTQSKATVSPELSRARVERLAAGVRIEAKRMNEEAS